MKNIYKAFLIGLFMVSCYWLSKQHTDTAYGQPFSNIRTTIVGSGGSPLILYTWNGPSNVITLNNTFWFFSGNTSMSITNVAGITNGFATWVTLVQSNTGPGDVISYSTVPFARSIGAQTHNPIDIPPGKVCIWSWLSVGGMSTNFVNSVQDAVSSASGVSLVAAGTNIYIITNAGLATISLKDPTIVNELDVNNLYGTNFFTLLTNSVLLKTDGNGQLAATDFTAATNNDIAVSNGLFVLIQNGTNGTSANATNNDLYTSNALWTIDHNNSINATNQGTVVSNGVITYINTIGSNDTNNDTVVSNGVVAHTITIAGTAGQISSSTATAQQLAANPSTTLSLPSPVVLPGLIYGNGQTLTNILPASIVAPTNGVSSASAVDFSVIEATTNIAGAVSFTSLSNFNPTNYNRALRHIINRTGSDQTITVGAWETDPNRQTATTYIATNNTTLELMFSMQVNVFTNVMSGKTFR